MWLIEFQLFITLLISTILTSHNVDSAKILGIFHFPVRSQHVLGSFLFKELAARGHKVTMISPYKMEKPVANYTEILVDSGLLSYMQNNFGKETSGVKLSIMQRLRMAPTMFQDFGQLFLESAELNRLLRSKLKFDLVIQLTLMNEAFLGIGHHYNAPTIPFFSTGANAYSNHIFGNTAPYATVETPFTSSLETIADRALNAFCAYVIDVIQYFFSLPKQEGLLKQHFPNAPPLRDLLDKVHIGLVNSHPAVEGSKPYVPNMIQIGGYYIGKPDPLNSEIKKFLDDASDGAILFSLGTNVHTKTFPKETIETFLRVFGSLKQHVVFKFDSPIEDVPNNVFISDWLPQTGILAHKNLKLFVTHAGLGGVAEGIYYNIPMLCIPFIGGQSKNCADLVLKGYGQRLDIDKLNDATLYTAINEVLSQPMYKIKMAAASDFYRNQPMKPLEKAIYWVEHVLKHKGADHFPKNAATKLTWNQQIMVDVMGVVLVFVMLCVIFVVSLLKFIVSLISRKTVADNDKVKKT